MQDFAPFTPRASGRKDHLASEVGKSASQPWLDNLNFDTSSNDLGVSYTVICNKIALSQRNKTAFLKYAMGLLPAKVELFIGCCVIDQ
jgi:hypothetical protein